MHPAAAGSTSALTSPLSAPAPVYVQRAYRYRVAPEINPGKVSALCAMQAEWSRMLPLAFSWHWSPFLAGGLMPRHAPRSGPQSSFPVTALVTSMKDLMAVAIQGQAQGWASNLANRVAKSVMRDTVLARDTGLRREMLWINRMRAWLLPYREQVKLLAAQPKKSDALQNLSLLASRSMRKLVRRYIALHRLPDPHWLPMQVNVLSSQWAASNVPLAAHWLRISTLSRSQRVELPIMGNGFADSVPGQIASTFSLVEGNKGWEVVATKRVAVEPWSEHRCDVLAIDLGLRTLMATSEGDVRSENFLDVLSAYDAQLIKLQRGLQGAGIKRLSDCRRYRVFVERLRGFLKTTMQTHLKGLLERHRPKKVIIEDLLFSGETGNLSRRMNRLLRRFGQRYFVQTLAEHSARYGFELELVEPAYSSQTCGACGFVHRDNRKGVKFECVACGHRAQADVNAAKNLARRSGQRAVRSSGERGTRWMRALEQWGAGVRQSIERAAPGSSRHHRAVGSARAGLKELTQKKTPARKLGSDVCRRLQDAAESKTLDGLLDGLGAGAFSNESVSTRYSG